MDAAFIQQNQIIERYLLGRLPLKGAQDFERFCRENPQVVASLGLQDRINAALRLLDASEEPHPWEERKPAVWQQLPVFAGVAALALVSLVAALVLLNGTLDKGRELERLQRELATQPLQPLQATRRITVEVARGGPPARNSFSIGEGTAELADMRFDLSWSKYNQFVVTIDRVDQGRYAVLSNLARDSNGHVRVALNSSALGPGEYTVQFEGLDLRRGTEPQGGARFRVRR